MRFLHFRHTATAGFTIVELAIVTVVIGILATITIVSYNGIQDRATNSQILSAVGQWESILRTYQAINTSSTASGLPVSDYNCLANASSNFPASTGLAASECIHGYPGSASFSAVYSSTLTADLQAVLGALVALPSGYLSPISGTVWSTQVYAQGVRYNNLAIQYYLKGKNANCGKGTATTSWSADTLTLCSLSLN